MRRFATYEETMERFHETTCERKPADPGDTRFETGMVEYGMEETPYWLDCINDKGEIYDRHFFATQGEVWDFVESFRHCQEVPFEEEFAAFGPAWQREQEGR